MTTADRYAALADQAARWCDLCGLPADTVLTWQVFRPVGADEAGEEVAGKEATFAATVNQLAAAARRRCDDAAFPNLYLTSGLHDPPRTRRQTTCRRVLALTLDADACDWLSATRPAEYADAAAAKAALHQLEPEPLAELLDEHQTALVAALLRLGIEPSALVRSGYGHYALLALEADDDAADVAACREVNRDLVDALNDAAGFTLADMQAKDCGTRVLRLPGAYNVKDPARPRPCEFLAVDGRRWPLAALRELVPHPERSAPAPPPAASPIGDTAPAGPGRLPDLEVARQALERIPADDYTDWVKAGMVLRDIDPTGGLAEWERWSATSSKFKPGDCEAKWRTFGHSTERVTLGYLVNRARERDPDFLAAGYRRGRDQGGPVARQKAPGGPAMREPDPEAQADQPAPRQAPVTHLWLEDDRPTRPRIIMSDRQLDDLVAEAIDVVCKANQPPSLFARLDELVDVGRDERGRAVIRTATTDGFILRLAQSAEWYTMRRQKSGEDSWKWVEVPARPNPQIARSALSETARPLWRFPALVAVTEVPTLRPDGSVLCDPGYDPQTKLYYAPPPGLTVPPIPQSPSQAEAKQALDRVSKLFAEFPFVDKADQANALALLLTPVVRAAVPSPVPLALIDAPQQGTGKSLIAQVVSLLAQGYDATDAAPARDDAEEWRKRLTSALLAGNALINFDNLEGELRNGSLAKALTDTEFRDRLLGSNTMASLPVRVTWIATGNNIRIGGDMNRRCYRIRLDAKTDKPWERKGFAIEDLPSYALDNRGELLAALLTAARAWFAAGRPAPAGDRLPRMGGYFPWVRIVGGILAFCGVDGFLSSQDELYEEADTDAANWRTFLSAWRNWNTDPVSTKQIAAAVASVDQTSFEKRNDDAVRLLAESIPEELMNPDGSVNPVRFGRKISTLVGRRFAADGLRVETAGSDRHAKGKLFQVVVDETPPEDETHLANESDEAAGAAAVITTCGGSSAAQPGSQSEFAEDAEDVSTQPAFCSARAYALNENAQRLETSSASSAETPKTRSTSESTFGTCGGSSADLGGNEPDFDPEQDW